MPLGIPFCVAPEVPPPPVELGPLPFPPPHGVGVSARWLRSRHHHRARATPRPLLPSLSTVHQTRALHIVSQPHLHPLRPSPHPCQRQPDRRRSSRQHHPALRKRSWATSSRRRGTSPQRQLDRIQFWRGQSTWRRFVRPLSSPERQSSPLPPIDKEPGFSSRPIRRMRRTAPHTSQSTVIRRSQEKSRPHR